MIYLILLYCSFSSCVVMSEFGYTNDAMTNHRRSKYDIPTSADYSIYDRSARYMPTPPAFNARWFIEERFKEKAPLSKKYPELGNNTLLSYMEKTEGLDDLKEKFFEHKKERAAFFKYMMISKINPLGSLPDELQLSIFKAAHPNLFDDITFMEYKSLSWKKTTDPKKN